MMDRGINDREVVLAVSNFHGEMSVVTPRSRCLRVVNDPRVLERALAQLLRLLLEHLNRPLDNAAALIDQMARRCRLPRVVVNNDNGVDVSLLLAI